MSGYFIQDFLSLKKGLFSLEGRYFNMMHCLIKYEGFTNTL